MQYELPHDKDGIRDPEIDRKHRVFHANSGIVEFSQQKLSQLCCTVFSIDVHMGVFNLEDEY